MHTKQILAIFSLFTSLAVAAPAGEVGDVSPRDASDLEKRSANFTMYGGDRCTDEVHTYFHQDGTGFRCYPVPAGKRSIRVFGSCSVRTWSGTDCRGGSAVITERDGCVTILYGSVSVDC
ncbi:uncharacterized protein B0H64DRAFT_378302 [Chaetomium fimeti]|uniref:Uncharacterized protein n=1 Tax=Chaetomium fimeti TaxID=1854472 RepID=A0AAE0H6Q1_9PEZI|nr:hypothetical protein B0H64DRAFT_378302 [Chaetomium fimeti]